MTLGTWCGGWQVMRGTVSSTACFLSLPLTHLNDQVHFVKSHSCATPLGMPSPVSLIPPPNFWIATRRVVSLVEQYGYGSRIAWLSAWEGVWRRNLESCTPEGECRIELS